MIEIVSPPACRVVLCRVASYRVVWRALRVVWCGVCVYGVVLIVLCVRWVWCGCGGVWCVWSVCVPWACVRALVSWLCGYSEAQVIGLGLCVMYVVCARVMLWAYEKSLGDWPRLCVCGVVLLYVFVLCAVIPRAALIVVPYVECYTVVRVP